MDSDSVPNNNIQDLIAPLSGDNSAGHYLRFTPIYDQIREARHQEDHTLSQGIWKRDYKRSDWTMVENLCKDALLNQSKDLQIAAWLCEAWIVLEGLSGLLKGLHLIHELCKAYWNTLYPLMDDNNIDYRLHIFEWMDKNLANRLIDIPLTNTSSATSSIEYLTLGNWLSALNLEKIIKRSSDSKVVIENAIKNSDLTLENFKKFFQRTSQDYIEDIIIKVDDIEIIIEKQKAFLNARFNNQSPSFNLIRENLNNISRLCKQEVEQREKFSEVASSFSQETVNENLSLNTDEQTIDEKVNQENNSDGTLSSRQDIYNALNEISQYLKKIDPHSPVPSLLELIVSWQNKNLLEILNEINSSEHEAHAFLRLIAQSVLNKK